MYLKCTLRICYVITNLDNYNNIILHAILLTNAIILDVWIQLETLYMYKIIHNEKHDDGNCMFNLMEKESMKINQVN